MDAGECQRLSRCVVLAVWNASNVDARRLHADEWDGEEGTEIDGDRGRLTAAAAVFWKGERALLDITTVTNDREKDTSGVNSWEPDRRPIEDFGPLVP